jgi:hypothetical protein
MKYRYLIFFILFAFIIWAQTTSPFNTKLEYPNGSAATGLDVDLYYYSSDTKAYDLTEINPGVYYHASVAHGEYYLYVGGVNKKQLWHGTRAVSEFLNAVDPDANNYIDGARMEDSTITKPKLSTTVNILLNNPGSGIAHPPDDVTLEFKITGVDTTVGLDSIFLDDSLRGKWRTDIEDTLNKANIINSDQYINGSIDYEHLSSLVQGRINTSTENLYDYQDVSLNSSLQMHGRYIDYLFEKYYDESQRFIDWEYSYLDTNLTDDRYVPVMYLKTLAMRYRETGRAKYLYKLEDVLGDLWQDCADEYHLTDSSITCKTMIPYADASGVSMPIDDAILHVCALELYLGDTTQTTYLQGVKNFADVIYSYIVKDGFKGWMWQAQKWTDYTNADSTERFNPATLLMWFYSEMKANNISGQYVNSTVIDSVLDSTYYYIMEYNWVDTTLATQDGGTVEAGAFKESGPGSGILDNYSIFSYNYLMACAEALSDTGWQSGWSDKMQRITYYHLAAVPSNWTNMIDFLANTEYTVARIAKKYNLSFSHRMLDSWVSVFKYPSPFMGYGSSVNWGINRERDMVNYMDMYGYSIAYFNDENWTESYSQPLDTTTYSGPNDSNFRLMDGHSFIQKTWLGALSTAEDPDYYIVLDHEDSSPGCDTSAWTYTGNHARILNLDGYPTFSNGLDYVIDKRMGSPFVKIVPSGQDTVFMLTDTLGAGETHFREAVYLFYYNVSGVLDTLNHTDFSEGDSIAYMPNKGAFFQVVYPSTRGVVSRKLAGFIANGNSGWLKMKRILGWDCWYTPPSALVDSVMFFDQWHHLENLYAFDNMNYGWDKVMSTANDVLDMIQTVWENGIDYEGILENKTN